MYVMSSKNVVVGVVIPWVELRSYSTTPNVDGDRGDPIPDQGYIKKNSYSQCFEVKLIKIKIKINYVLPHRSICNLGKYVWPSEIM